MESADGVSSGRECGVSTPEEASGRSGSGCLLAVFGRSAGFSATSGVSDWDGPCSAVDSSIVFADAGDLSAWDVFESALTDERGICVWQENKINTVRISNNRRTFIPHKILL